MDFFSMGIGVIIGGVIMFFVYSNNKKKMSLLNDKIQKELDEKKAELKELAKEKIKDALD
jgi:uncharacterized membrane-anchored protein YhcB (DUF1043 family)